jgi:Tol biopolymer transport system component
MTVGTRLRMRVLAAVVPAVASVVIAPSLAPVVASTGPGPTPMVSVDPVGAPGNGASFLPGLTSNGRLVTFESRASTLVLGDANGQADVFVRDRDSNTTSRVSFSSGGTTEGNGASGRARISADGSVVAFQSAASNLVAGDTNGQIDVFVHDRLSATTSRVSVTSSGGQGAGVAFEPSLSADGRLVAFTSNAPNMVAGDTNGHQDVFVHDRQAGTTVRVSIDSVGAQAGGFSRSPAISADGRAVAFRSQATNLAPGDTNGVEDVFVHDRQMGTTNRVSVGAGGAQADRASGPPAVSADGRFLAYESSATNLVPGDANGLDDVFVLDRQSGETTKVSVQGGTTEAHTTPAISADGRFVVFESAGALVPDDTNSRRDIFLHDRQTGATTRESVDAAGVQGDGSSTSPALSADGKVIGFASLATNLSPNDTNGFTDVFVHEIDAGGVPPNSSSTTSSTTSPSSSTTTTTAPTTTSSSTSTSTSSTTSTTTVLPTTTTAVSSTTTSALPPNQRSDLHVREISVPQTAQKGEPFVARDVVENREGRGVAGASVTSYHLSVNDEKDAGDIQVGERAVEALARDARSAGAPSLVVPPAAPDGRFHLIACVDAKSQVREIHEKNNCRATTTLVFVHPAPVAVPVAPASRTEPSCGNTSYFDTLASNVVRAPDLTSAIGATKVLLTTAGVGVAEDSAGPSAEEPRGGVRVGPMQLVNLARDGRVRAWAGRITLGEVAFEISAAGVPVKKADGGRDLARFLRSAVEVASTEPSAAHSAAPLLLAALAQCQKPAIDLTAGYVPDDYRLTALDLTLLGAVFAQIAPGIRGGQPVPTAAADNGSADTASESFSATMASAEATAASPCGAVRDTLERLLPLAGQLWGYAAGQAAQDAAQKYVDSAASYLDAGDAGLGEKYSSLLSWTGLLLKMQTLALLYDTATARVEELADDPVHKPTPVDPRQLVGFEVIAGVPDEEWEAYQAESFRKDVDAFRECASIVGFPVPTNLGDLGAAVSGWHVKWQMIEGAEHAFWSSANDLDKYDLPGQVETKLRPRNDHSGSHLIAAELKDEAVIAHPGDLQEAPVTVKAEVRTDTPPNLGTFLGALPAGAAINVLGVATAVGDLAVGLFQHLVTMDAYETVRAEFHLPRRGGGWRGLLQDNEHYRDDCSSPDVFRPRHVVTDRCQGEGRRTSIGYVVEQLEERRQPGRIEWRLKVQMNGSQREEVAIDGYEKVTGRNGCTATWNTHIRNFGAAAGTSTYSDVVLTIFHTGAWQIDFKPAQAVGEAIRTQNRDETHEGPGDCPHHAAWEEDKVHSYQMAASPVPRISGTIDPANPGRVLNGDIAVSQPGNWRLLGTGAKPTRWSSVSLTFDGTIPVPKAPSR